MTYQRAIVIARSDDGRKVIGASHAIETIHIISKGSTTRLIALTMCGSRWSLLMLKISEQSLRGGCDNTPA